MLQYMTYIGTVQQTSRTRFFQKYMDEINPLTNWLRPSRNQLVQGWTAE